MKTTIPPFTPHPNGRLRQVERALFLDASEMSWYGALDGTADMDGRPWEGLAARSYGRWERGESISAIRAEASAAEDLGPSTKLLRVAFAEAATWREKARAPWTDEFKLESVPCPYGGVRHFFVCAWCKRRKARVFRVRGYWACRAPTCHHLCYKSQQEHDRCSRHGKGLRRFSHWLDMGEAQGALLERRTSRRRRWKARSASPAGKVSTSNDSH